MTIEPSRPSGEPTRRSPAAFVASEKRFLLVARPRYFAIGHDPDLQEMHRLGTEWLNSPVADPRAGGHDLHVAGRITDPGANCCPCVRARLENVEMISCSDAVVPKPAPGRTRSSLITRNGPKPICFRIVIIAEREGVPAVEPPEVGLPAFRGESLR